MDFPPNLARRPHGPSWQRRDTQTQMLSISKKLDASVTSSPAEAKSIQRRGNGESEIESYESESFEIENSKA